MRGRLIETDLIRSPERLAAVRESRLLDTSPEHAFDELTRLAATLIDAPFAFATVVDDVRSYWKSRFGLGPDAPVQNTVEESFCQYVIAAGSEVIIEDAAGDARTRENPSVHSMGVRAWAGFPLRSPDGEILGSFCAVDTLPRAWSAEEIGILRALAHAASREVALRTAMLDQSLIHRRLADLARTLQESLVPPEMPDVAGLQIAARYHPAGSGAELVGDFYDVFVRAGDEIDFIIGDVCGKGVEAAKAAALARYTVSAAALTCVSSAGVLPHLNHVFLSRKAEPDLYLTALYGALRRTPGGHIVRLSSGGHPLPLVRRTGGTVETVNVAGPIVGMFAGFEVAETSIVLRAGDAFIAFTDGVNEARRDRVMFGEAAFAAVIDALDPQADAQHVADAIVDAALAFADGNADDDIAVLVVRTMPASA